MISFASTGRSRPANAALSRLLNPHGEAFCQHLSFGDRVILTANDHERGVMNGETGVILRSPQGGGFAVRFDDGETRQFNRDEADKFLRAYAITVHRSQGSQHDTVILAMCEGQRAMLDRAILYTGWTRAKNTLVLVGDHAAFVRAAATNASATRATALAEFCRLRLPPLAPKVPATPENTTSAPPAAARP